MEAEQRLPLYMRERHWAWLRRKTAMPSFRNWTIALLYLALIFLAESCTTFFDPQAGMALNSGILLALLLHSSVESHKPVRRFLIILTLAPLLRILSLSLPLTDWGIPMIYWYVVVGVPIFLAAFAAGRIAELGWRRIGWSWQAWPWQILFGLVGLPCGFIEYAILKPSPLIASPSYGDLVSQALILLIFTGLLEEYIFRGMLQSSAMHALGRYGLIFTNVLFAILHLGYFSAADFIFVLCIGLFFGWLVWKHQFLFGVSLAHGMINIGLYILFPLLMPPGH